MLYSTDCRSILFTPAMSPDRYPKAFAAGADICLVDLEDSVAARDKQAARELAGDFFSHPAGHAVRRAIRINAVSEPDGLRDLLALRDLRSKPDIVLLPKVEAARDIELVDRVLGDSFLGLRLMAVIETPRGVENAGAIASASPRMHAVIFGAADYSFTVGGKRNWAALAAVRSRLVNSARAAGVEVIDSPTFELSDLDLLEHESALAKELGFSGRAALHPRQVPVINRHFSPDQEGLELARRIVTSCRTSNNSVTVVDGMMVGRPFFDAAERLLHDFGGAATLAD